MENRDRGLVPSRNRDRVVERTPRVLGEVDWAEDPSNLDHHRLLTPVPPKSEPRATALVRFRRPVAPPVVARTFDRRRHAW